MIGINYTVIGLNQMFCQKFLSIIVLGTTQRCGKSSWLWWRSTNSNFGGTIGDKRWPLTWSQMKEWNIIVIQLPWIYIPTICISGCFYNSRQQYRILLRVLTSSNRKRMKEYFNSCLPLFKIYQSLMMRQHKDNRAKIWNSGQLGKWKLCDFSVKIYLNLNFLKSHIVKFKPWLI